jgi:farnesyl diphosphate synthase/geranylgeranyl diphosphate synthase type II
VTTRVAAFIEHFQQRLNLLLKTHQSIRNLRVPGSLSTPGTLVEASQYSLGNGGKRIRPLLVYSAGMAIDNDVSEEVLDYPALAVELIHTYSLIHDDLPAMDDDDLRRGEPTLHKAYDEATAILAGDGLQALAFEVLAQTPEATDHQRVSMITQLARASGPFGMVGGQFIDIQATDSDLSLGELSAMHSMKTGALICASLTLGGTVANASEAQLQALQRFGSHIGLAFQVVDDILDVESDTATLGKTQGKDAEANKPTYIKLLGLEGAKSEAQRLLSEAHSALGEFGESADNLRHLADYIVNRSH